MGSYFILDIIYFILLQQTIKNVALCHLIQVNRLWRALVQWVFITLAKFIKLMQIFVQRSFIDGLSIKWHILLLIDALLDLIPLVSFFHLKVAEVLIFVQSIFIKGELVIFSFNFKIYTYLILNQRIH